MQHAIPFTFFPPVNPGPTVVYPLNPTQHQIIASNKLHEKNTKLFKQYNAYDRPLKQLLLGAVNSMLINTMSKSHVGYVSVTTLQLRTHLYDIYGHITNRDLEKKTLMSQLCNINFPNENFFRYVEEFVAYAVSGNTPYST